MKQMVRGAIAILALSGLAACVDDPLLPLNGDADRIANDRVVANVRQGDSVAVLLRLTNAADRATPTTFEITNVGAGIAVNRDPKFRPEYVNGSDTLVYPEVKSVQRYFIRGIAPGEYNYTVTSQGISGTFKVRVEPINIGAALSRTTAVAGDDVTITAPAGTSFSPTSAVSFGTGALAVKSRAADNKSIVVTVGPGVTGPATVTLVKLDYFPALPGLTLATTNTLTTPALAAAATTVSAATPNAGAPVNVTLGGSLRFLGAGKVFVGGVEAGITALSADSATATIVPALNSSGAVTFTGIALSFLTNVVLALPSDGKTIAPTATFGGTTLPGGTDIANAPEIALPTVAGRSTVITDQGAYGNYATCLGALGGNSCRIYKIVVPATTTYTVVGTWSNNADLGIYRLTSAGAFAATVADALIESPTRTESGSMASLAAGTYYLAVVWYTATEPQPTTLQLRISR